VQFILASVFAFVFAERWQRWRQRRDFQYRTLGKFSELSYEMMDRLAELLVTRGQLCADDYRAKHREFVSRWTLFVALRSEVLASFGRGLVHTEAYQGAFDALNRLRGHAIANQPVPQAQFEPDQERFLAHREAVVAHMIHDMGLLRGRAWQAEVHSAHARLRAIE
jgi:hypothetical protein